MKHTQLATLGVWMVVVFFTGCGREESQPPSPKAVPANKSAAATPTQSTSSPKVVATTAPTDEHKKPSGRQPKRKHPQLVIPQEQPNPTAERLRTELGSIDKNDPALPAKVSRIWGENVAHLPTTTLPSAADAAVANGTKLPKEIGKATEPNRPSTVPEAMLKGLSLTAAATRTELLSQFAQQRANALPPTAADVAIFEALNDGIGELSPTREASSFEAWEPLASAANPIYRLLALRAAMHTTSRAAASLSSEDPNYTRVDAPAKLGFYLRYLNESDPTILSEAIAAIATVPTPEARQAIEKFQVTQQQRGDAALAQVAADALRTQEIIAQGAR